MSDTDSGRERSGFVDPLREDADTTVLVCIERDANRRQLLEWLPDRFAVVGLDEVEPVDAFDLCLADERSLRRHREALCESKRRQAPLYLPVLLVVTERDRDVTSNAMRFVDEVVRAPVRKRELRRRIDVLLRARRSSVLLRDRTVELRRRSEEVEFLNSLLRHDVLNGITVIRGYADLLVEDLEGEPRTQAETIRQWSDDVNEVVQRVRRFLGALSGEERPALKRVDLAEVVAAELDRVRATYPAVTFTTDVPAEVPVLADDLLGESVGNVLTNAIEHNDPADLSVSVRVRTDDDGVKLRIADTGRGIPDDRKQAVFRRGETERSSGVGGFGLFFVETMLEAYGGDVWVEDNDPRGAAFTMLLRPPGSAMGRHGDQ